MDYLPLSGLPLPLAETFQRQTLPFWTQGFGTGVRPGLVSLRISASSLRPQGSVGTMLGNLFEPPSG